MVRRVTLAAFRKIFVWGRCRRTESRQVVRQVGHGMNHLHSQSPPLTRSAFAAYFFGYGNYVSAWGSLGFTINRHVSVNAGYQLGSRLVVNRDTSTNRIGLNLTEKGPAAGMEFSF